MLPVYSSDDSKITVWVTDYRDSLVEINTYIFYGFTLFCIEIYKPKDYVNKIYKHADE